MAIAKTLGGDTAVVNPSRVLRLAGSIAWPRKEGRIAELTELLLPASGKPAEYLLEQVAKAFAPVDVDDTVPVSTGVASHDVTSPDVKSPPISPAETSSTLQIGSTP